MFFCLFFCFVVFCFVFVHLPRFIFLGIIQLVTFHVLFFYYNFFTIHLFQVRFVKGDRIPMSVNYRRDSCHITMCISNPSDYHKDLYFQGFYKVLVEKGFKPRLHWGKSFHLSHHEVQSMYPLLADFLKLRKELDSGDVFFNKLLSSFITKK